MASNDTCHRCPVAKDILLGVPTIGEVFALKDLTSQIRVSSIYSGVDDSNGDAFSLRLSPNIFCCEYIQRPLLISNVVR